MTTTKKPKRKTRDQLIVELDEANKRAARYYDERSQALTEVDAVNKRAAKTREQFGDLKARLLEAEKEIGRLNGYMARVHEDDIVRDGMIEIEDERGKRMVPKRQPPMMSAREAIFHGYTDYQIDPMTGRREKSTHWTDY